MFEIVFKQIAGLIIMIILRRTSVRIGPRLPTSQRMGAKVANKPAKGAKVDPRDALPLLRISLSRTAESQPRSEVVGWVKLQNKFVKVHVKTFTGEPKVKLGERLNEFIEAEGCSKAAALAWLDSLP